MGFSLFRLGRFLRSIFVPTASIVSFSLLLTYIFVLYQPTPGPGSIQKLGWQSWDVVTDSAVNDQSTGALDTTSGTTTSTGSTGSTGSGNTVGTVPVGVDWWNVSTSAETVDTASLPLDVWDPLMQHDTGRECSFCIHSFLWGWDGMGWVPCVSCIAHAV